MWNSPSRTILEANRIDVHSVSARKPLFMDESAHDWRLIRLGRELGWTGVALKTCKTQTGAILSLCWAKAHGQTLMVQDLTNPDAGPDPPLPAGGPRRDDHGGRDQRDAVLSGRLGPRKKPCIPGLYRRRRDRWIYQRSKGPGFGYRLDEIERKLPEPVVSVSK